ncbi:MAG: sigma-70 family RNA polymerase sigma factor [Chthoniobacterales bacterium]|nr:sigma-70 family RNA polymerase sigma factor [Chthoniobacterales bacterium]
MIQPSIIDRATLTAASDEALMKAITERHQTALRELYKRYGKTLKAVVTHVVHEEAEADDVLQEIFLQIWKEAANYSPRAGKPLGWVVTLARRRAIDRLRRRQAYCRAKDRFEEQIEQQPNSRVRNGIDDELIRSDLRRFLERQMDTLPDFQREAIDLSYFKGLSQREIAARTRTPLGTVKTRLELGLRKLTNCVRPLRRKI